MVTTKNLEAVTGKIKATTWSPARKFSLRVTVIYIIQLCIPLSFDYYRRIFSFGSAGSGRNWQAVSRYTGFHLPRYVDIGTDIWELYSYINLVVALVIALGIAALWTAFDRKGTEVNPRYNKLYYWSIVVLRYTAALGIIAWGFKKFVPKQMELPSRTFMETPFGDFSEQKIYWQYVGLSQGYEIFLGFAEIAVGVLLLFRKTTAVGAVVLALLLFNVCLANHAYDGMVHVGSFMYTLAGMIIVWPYLQPVWKLLGRKETVTPYYYAPAFNLPWQRYTRIAIKALIIGVFVFYNYYLHLNDYVGYRYPHDYTGLTNAAGTYEVTEFRLNNQVIPYSPVDSVRWQDAIFEDWNTLTVLRNRKQHMDNANTARDERKSIDRRFEFRGIGGGRHYYTYTADTVQQVLHLINKNKAHRNETYTLKYTRPGSERIILEGVDNNNDSLYVVLDRTQKDYTLKAELIEWYYDYKKD